MSDSRPFTDPSARRRLFVAAAMTMFVFGMLVAMLGTLFGLPATRARLGIDLAQQGDLFSVLFTGLFVAAAVVGPLLEHSHARHRVQQLHIIGVGPNCQNIHVHFSRNRGLL